MSNEISHEAQVALAAARQRRARERLHRDGAESTPAMQRRIQALAAERSIPVGDFAKLLYKRVSTQAIIDFCNKHDVSSDWLLCGDLRGLHRMTRDRAARPPRPPVLTPEQFRALYAQLPPSYQEYVAAMLRGLVSKAPQS